MSFPAHWLLASMEPAYQDANISWSDAEGEVFYEVLEADSLEKLSTYLSVCEEFAAFSRTHYSISPPVLSLTIPTGGHADVAQVLLAILDNIYASGGRVYNLNMRSHKWALPVCQHVAKLAHQYSRSCNFLTLEGICRTDSHISTCFPSSTSSGSIGKSVAYACKSLDVSGNKLRDPSLKAVLEVLLRENRVTSLCLDGCDVGNASCSVLYDWLRKDDCSLRDLSLRDCGIFSSRPGSFQSSTSAEKLAAAISGANAGGSLGHGSRPTSASTSTRLTSLVFGVIPNSVKAGGGEILGRTIALLKGNSALRTLALDGCVDLAEDHVRDLGDMLTSTACNLVNLDLSYCRLNNQHIARLCQELHVGSRCISLNLAGNSFSDLSPLLPLVRDRLRLLNLSGNKFFSDAVRPTQQDVPPYLTEEDWSIARARYFAALNLQLHRFLDRVAQSHCLKHLNLDNCQLSSTNITVLFTRLAMCWMLCPSPSASTNMSNKYSKKNNAGRAIMGAGETSLSHLSLNNNGLGIRGIGYIASVLTKHHACHNLRHLGLQKTLGGIAYKSLLQEFLSVDRRVLTVVLSSDDLLRADDTLALAAVAGPEAIDQHNNIVGGHTGLPEMPEMPLSLLHICNEKQPRITTVSVPLYKKLAIISAMRNQKTGRLRLPSDCIYTILQFMRSSIERRIQVM